MISRLLKKLLDIKSVGKGKEFVQETMHQDAIPLTEIDSYLAYIVNVFCCIGDVEQAIKVSKIRILLGNDAYEKESITYLRIVEDVCTVYNHFKHVDLLEIAEAFLIELLEELKPKIQDANNALYCVYCQLLTDLGHNYQLQKKYDKANVHLTHALYLLKERDIYDGKHYGHVLNNLLINKIDRYDVSGIEEYCDELETLMKSVEGPKAKKYLKGMYLKLGNFYSSYYETYKDEDVIPLAKKYLSRVINEED